MVSPDDILNFWLDEVGPEGWYGGGDALDERIRNRFMEVWEQACDGALGLWLTYPSGTLAYIILTDQFPRNMFRGQARAFATDRSARAAAKSAISRNWDLKIDEPARSFFYLPLEHSENLIDQDRAVRLIHTRITQGGDGQLIHAKVHRDIIRRFGRFPFRNDALGRETTAAEAAFLDAGGYGAVYRALAAESKA
jgi:uncharacterized protein (DUF924 family)